MNHIQTFENYNNEYYGKIELEIKKQMLKTIGLDRTEEVLDKDWLISPITLIKKAVTHNTITFDEIPNVINSAIRETEKITHSEEDITDNDILLLTMNMLKSAGLNVNIIHNRLLRLD
jgi:transcriptional regulator NrdR family protein